MTARGGRNLRQALAYACHGWPVFPVKPGGKEPALPSAHGRGEPACTGECGHEGHGFHDATTDPERIRAWWAADLSRNVGLATGCPGPDVVDVDNHGRDANGFAAWNAARREGLVARPLAMVQTPSGGLHAYFNGTEQASAKLRQAHMDLQARGAYVVAPHSMVGGRPYVVVARQPSPATADFAVIKALVQPEPERAPWKPPERLRAGSAQDLSHLPRFVAEQGEGNRNGALFWAACRVLDHGQPEHLEELAAAAVSAGLSRREADRTIRSAQAQARQDPHATPQLRGPVQLAPGREPEPQPAGGGRDRQDASRQESARGRVAALEADRDGPGWKQATKEASDAEAWGGRGPSASYAEWLAEGREPEPGAEVAGRSEQPEPDHQAEPGPEPEHGRPSPPFAEAGAEPEREAGE
jgi:Bifunctional DNA primase/polymerase, N-terminal